MVRSGATLTRPVRSSATSAPWPTPPSGEDLTAVHKIVDVWMVSVASPLRVVTALSRTSVTSVLVRTVTPNCLRSAAAWADRSGRKQWPRSALPLQQEDLGLRRIDCPKASFSVPCAFSSPSVPANSPVGPPPMITNVMRARRFSGSGSRSAA